MPAVPSIKGSVFATVVEDVGKSLASGSVKRDQLSRWLRPEDIALLGEKIAVASWYPIQSYTRMGLLLRDVEGGGDNEAGQKNPFLPSFRGYLPLLAG